ncbi:fumarylacetoacetate hydrolase family protein [Membranihabitans maritimus]|uniref:fumarylacetoacetate hydrolase family protein n=1 Tax=Membranihabitans maritimus TaxID=2904244 RepID=UPI001F003B12|nr:fumarylacetoacetate hydrolase family protein [Membranihabitans maritimus]
MKIYKTKESGVVVEDNQQFYYFENEDWDSFINRENLYAIISRDLRAKEPGIEPDWNKTTVLSPVGRQEIWAAGVTYLRSKDARMKESQSAEGGDFYDKVYDADRPELFFKSTPERASGPFGIVNIRPDSTWDVPEPELTLFVSSAGTIEGYTIGNDMSSRSIEGENPLYLPQAKMYDKSAAIGPCLYVPGQSIFLSNAKIKLTISRNGHVEFEDEISIDQMKRTEEELKDYLVAGCSFPHGCYLMTGTGIVPDDDFTLQPGDIVVIEIEHIGKLENTVGMLGD